MLKSVFRIWPVVLVLVGVLGSCAPQRVVPPRNPVVIGGAVGSPSFAPDTVVARRGDYLLWPNPFDVTVSVELRGAPMRPARQIIPVGGTGKVQVLPNAEPGIYKYNVVLTSGNDTILVVDPYIDVEEKSRPGGGS